MAIITVPALPFSPKVEGPDLRSFHIANAPRPHPEYILPFIRFDQPLFRPEPQPTAGRPQSILRHTHLADS